MEMIQMQIQILVFLIIGWIFGRKGWISRTSAGQLNFLVMNLILPCSIFHAFCTPLTEEILQSASWILVLACLLQVGFWIVSKLIWKRIPDKSEQINLEYGTVCNNAGTLGMVIGQAAFGSEGVLYTSIYAIPLRMVLWGYGLPLYTKSDTLKGKQLAKKVLTNPCMIAIVAGILMMAASSAGFILPSVVDSIITSLAQCNTPMIMIVIGVILSDLPLKDLTGKEPALYCLIRLVFLPALCLVILQVLGIGGMPLKICVLETAMPAPVTMAMLSQRYRQNESFASRLVFLSTVLSMITLPLWTLALNMI